MTSKSYKFFEDNLPDTIIEQIYDNIANDMPITVNDPSVELEMLFIDDLVEEMFDALECKKHHFEFDGVNTLLTENGRYCDAPVTHKATLGYNS